MGQATSRDKLLRTIQKMASSGKLHSLENEEGTIVQWVSSINGFSSQYDSHNWCANQVVGPPKVYPKYGDIHGAWASQHIDQHQFLELEFEEEVFVTGIDIYETYHAGGVKAVKARDGDGKWKTLFKADRAQVIKQSRIFSPQLKELGCRSKHIRVEIDCSVSGTWVEIDAVKLKGKAFLTAPPPSMNDLAADYETIVNDPQFSDIQFMIEGRSVYAHKAILCARSDYFRAMFSNKMKETYSQKPLDIIDVDYDSFLAVLYFLYANKIPNIKDSLKLTDLWRVADKFSMDGLKTLTTFMISEKINETNVVDTYVAATNSVPIIDEIKINCMTYMSSNMNKIVNTKSFTALPQEIMLEIIQGATAKLTL